MTVTAPRCSDWEHAGKIRDASEDSCLLVAHLISVRPETTNALKLRVKHAKFKIEDLCQSAQLSRFYAESTLIFNARPHFVGIFRGKF